MARWRSAVSVPTSWAAAAIVLTAAVRIAVLASDRSTFNADEATTGLVVRDILAGHFRLFYPGQTYGGTLEQYVQALTYAVVPLPHNAFTLRLPLVAVDMGTCALIYLIAREILTWPAAGPVAAFAYALGPWFNVVGGVTSFGFYVTAQFLATAGIYCALRLNHDPGRRVWAAAFGVCFGLGVWTGAFTLYLLLPAALWLLPVLVRRRFLLRPAAAGLLLGLVPVLLWTLRHGRLPIGQPEAVIRTAGRWQRLVDPVYREFVGVAYHAGDPPPASTAWLATPIVLLATATFVGAAWQRRHGLAALVRGGVTGRNGADILLLAVPVTVALYLAAPSTWYIGTPRYLFVAYPVWAVGLAALVSAVPTPAGRRLAAALAVAVVATLTAQYFATSRPPESIAARDAALRAVTAELVGADERVVYSGYWTAVPLDYVADGQLTVLTCVGPQRFPVPRTRPDPVYVIDPSQEWDRHIVAVLDAHHVGYRTTVVGRFRILDGIGPTGRPEVLGLT